MTKKKMAIFDVFLKTRFFEKNFLFKSVFSRIEIKEMLSKKLGKKLTKTRNFEENSLF
jgi:hypothetical protein